MKKLLLTLAVVAFFVGGVTVKASAAKITKSTKIELTAGDKWDKLLDEYEHYVEMYSKTYKKAMSGDMRAANSGDMRAANDKTASECQAWADKAQKIAQQLEKGKNEMTAAQKKRYQTIAKKMSDVAKQKTDNSK